MSPISNSLSIQEHNELIKDYFLTQFHKNKWNKEDANNHFLMRKLELENEFEADDFYNNNLSSDTWYDMVCFLIDKQTYEDKDNRCDEEYYFEYIYYYGLDYIKSLTDNEFVFKMNELTNLFNRVIRHSNN